MTVLVSADHERLMAGVRLAIGMTLALATACLWTGASAQTIVCNPAQVTPRNSVHVGPGAQEFKFDVQNFQFQCFWVPPASDAGWLTFGFVYIAPGAPGFFGFVTANIAQNETGATREGHVTLPKEMGVINIIQDASPCVVAPATVQVPRGGGQVAIPIQTTLADCGWRVTTPFGFWVTVTQTTPQGQSVGTVQAVGPASLVLSVASNETGTGPRSTDLVVGGETITVNQDPPLCVFAVSPTSIAVPAGGGSGTIALSGSGTDCSYTAATAGNVAITSGGSGVAPSMISYSVPSTTSDQATIASITVGGATLQISQAAPAIATDVPVSFPSSPGGLSFGVYRTNSGTLGSEPARVAIANATTPASGWSAASDQAWVTLSALTGPTPGHLVIGIDRSLTSSLPLGVSAATVSVASPIPAEGVRRIPIWLWVADASNAAPPRGAFDTPNTTVPQSGAIPVTGWALDDVGIQRIVIYRAVVAGESGDAIYIGDANRVAGARPDAARTQLVRTVNGRFTSMFYPEASLAGWGYMLLSNVLPGGGNGTFTFMVDAVDKDGHTTRLGTRTVTINNSASVRPFGTIDEPAQGATVTGTVVNRGWVLTPQPKTIPVDGSTIRVYIDGALVSAVSQYGLPRPDVQGFFPGLANSDGPGGQLSIDTTTLSNGVHTIAWGVIDDNGAAEGIGSRYFTVQNGFSSLVQAPATVARATASLTGLPVLKTDVWSREGVTESGWATRIETDPAGGRTMHTRPGERVELFLDPTLAAPCGVYDGHLLDGSVAGPLPMGASLDSQHGIFRWQIGAETAGRFAFVFVQRGCDGAERRLPVTIVISAE